MLLLLQFESTASHLSGKGIFRVCFNRTRKNCNRFVVTPFLYQRSSAADKGGRIRVCNYRDASPTRMIPSAFAKNTFSRSFNAAYKKKRTS